MNNFMDVNRRCSYETDQFTSCSSCSSTWSNASAEPEGFDDYSQPSQTKAYKIARYVMAKRLERDLYNLEFLAGSDFDNINQSTTVFERELEEAMDERVIACEELHKNVYADTCSHIPLINERDLFQVVLDIADELYNYEEMSWKKVVSWYTFGANMALYCFRMRSPEMVPKVALWFGHYVDDVLEEWIEEKGGWEDFIRYQKEELEQGSSEKDIRQASNVRRLLSVGLGAGMTLGAVTLGAVLAGRA